MEPAAHRLPQEIVDMFIGHHSGDPDVLLTLALVSRSWLHSARTHLFAEVSLYAAEPLSDSEVDFDPLERVNFGLELVKSSPAIASCIRSVTLSGMYADITVQGFEFLSHLSNIRSLAFSEISWPDLRSVKVPIQKALSLMASTLESLSFLGIESASALELLAFIRACPNIKSLEFGNIKWEEDLHISHASEPVASVFRDLACLWGQRPVCLKQISFRHLTWSALSQPFVEMLLTRDAFKLDLQEFVLVWQGNGSSSLQETFSHAVGSSLKTITLYVCVPYNQDPSDIIRLLSQCNQLSSFTLTSIPHYREPLLQWFEPVLNTLAEASSSHLREIIIKCTLYTDVERNHFLPWAKLDSAVSNTRRFPVFKKLRILIISSWVWRADASWAPYNIRIAGNVCRNLEQSMPRAVKAGLLEVVRCVPTRFQLP